MDCRSYFKYGLIGSLLLVINVSLYAQDYRAVSNVEKDTGKVIYLLDEANVQRASSATDSALALLKQALHISQSIDYKKGIAGALMSIAFCYQDKGDYKKSKELLYVAYPYCKTAPDNKRLMLSVYNGFGGTYSLLGNNDSAIHFFYKALDLVEKNPPADRFLLAQIYANLGIAWMQKHELDKGLNYLKKAKLMAMQLKDSLFLANVYCNMGVTYLAQKDTVSAFNCYQPALQIYQQKQNRRGLQFVYYALGDMQQDHQKAISYYRAALEMDSLTAFAAGIYQGLGSAYYLSGAYRKAEAYYKKSQLICEKQGLLTQRLANYSALSSIYGHLGNYKEAYQYQVAYASLNDSLLNTAKIEAVNALDVKYRTTEKDKILAQNKVQLYRQQKWIMGFAAGILLLCGLLFGLYRNHHQKQKLQTARLQNLEQKQKIEQLHAKMQGEEEERSRIARELHDGVNVLLSATKMNYAALGKEYKGLPETNSYGEVMQLLNEMGLELRTITYKLVPELLIQQSLPDAVETFCELIRKGNNLYIEFQSWGSFTALPAEYCFAIYRVVQELVHNIIKHAHATSTLIQLRHQDGLLCLTVEDNGNGFDPDHPGSGLGLQSVRTRIKDLGGQVTFSSAPGEGTSVEVEITTETG